MPQTLTEEWKKQLFSASDYPVLADSRDANKGNSSHIRYRKKPIVFEGKEIYVTTQWFEKNRDDVINEQLRCEWYGLVMSVGRDKLGLDGSAPDEEVDSLIDLSYELTAAKKKKQGKENP